MESSLSRAPSEVPQSYYVISRGSDLYPLLHHNIDTAIYIYSATFYPSVVQRFPVALLASIVPVLLVT